jgi:hypothetical protein
MSRGSSGSADRLIKYSLHDREPQGKAEVNSAPRLLPAYFRWYSPAKAFFDRSWKMGNIKEIE